MPRPFASLVLRPPRRRRALRRGAGYQGPARATVTVRLCTLAGFYEYAVEKEHLDYSPAAHVGRLWVDYESMPVRWTVTSSAPCWWRPGSARRQGCDQPGPGSPAWEWSWRAGRREAGQEPARPAKRDPADSRWLAACFERGAITSCFAVTPEFRVIRLHTRYRRDLTEERTREKQRAEKLLESAAIKISSVLTDLHGVTGRDIMDHLIAGERNPKVPDWLARAAARRKISQLEEAVEGAEFFTDEHAALLAKVLARIDRLAADIEDLSR